jgi:hypothetical protein
LLRLTWWTSAAPRVVLATVLCASGATLFAAGTATAASRGIELVTPPDSGPYQAWPLAATDDGSSFYWLSGGFFGSGAGDPAPEDGGFAADVFLAKRSATGWSTELLTNDPPKALVVGPFLPGMTADGLVYGTNANLVPEDQNNDDLITGEVLDLYRVAGGATTWLTSAADGSSGSQGIGINPPPHAVTPDLSAVAFATRDSLVAEDTDGALDVYLRRADGLHLVSTDTSGAADNSGTDAAIGHDDSAEFGTSSLPISGFPATQGMSSLAADAATLVFRTSQSLDAADTDSSRDLYLWRDGSVSLISDGESGSDCDTWPDCQPRFSGMSASGATIYFTTAEALTADDTDTADDVYEYDPAVPVGQRLTLASGDGTSPANVVTVTRDGRMFFATTDRIGTNPPDPGTTLVIYGWDGSQIRTVSALGADDPSIPSSDSEAQYPRMGRVNSVVALYYTERPVRATADGNALVFATTAQLDPRDTDNVRDLYLWRAGSGLELVSAGGGGTYPAAIGGEDVDFNGELAGGGRVIDADASRVFFTSGEALTPDAGDNGQAKVYEWEQGKVTLLSPPGSDARTAIYTDSSVSGDDVYFTTTDALVPEDGDGSEIDVYDARVGGGFPSAAPSTVGASPGGGTAGQVPAGPKPGSLAPSVEAAPPAGPPSPVTDDTADLPSLTIGRRSFTARGKRLTIPVDVSVPGRLRAELRLGKNGRVLARGARTFRSAQSDGRLGLRLTQAGERTLAGGRKARVTLRLVLDPQEAGDRLVKSYAITVKRGGSATSTGGGGDGRSR